MGWALVDELSHFDFPQPRRSYFPTDVVYPSKLSKVTLAGSPL